MYTQQQDRQQTSRPNGAVEEQRGSALAAPAFALTATQLHADPIQRDTATDSDAAAGTAGDATTYTRAGYPRRV
ncbi:MAG: hypothetical protein OHK0039_37210 [Bacteroidia bacterium]